MKYLSVASGSSGNCHYIEKKTTKILIDVGISGKAADTALRSRNIELSNVDAILITHEHLDHIKGIGVVSRRYDIPVYATPKTWEAIGSSMGKLKEKNYLFFEKNRPLTIGDLQLKPFATSHDAVDSCGFVIEDGITKIAVATDLGCVTPVVESALSSCDLVVLEANHDIEMLKMGNYPYHLKRRVLSERGHLSNDASAELATKLVTQGTKSILLAHLSGENNLPILAYETVASWMQQYKIRPDRDVTLAVLSRNQPTEIIDVYHL